MPSVVDSSKGEVRCELQWVCPLMRRKLCLGAREKDEGTLMSRKRSVICGTEKEKEQTAYKTAYVMES